jgi:hypothetical protein
LSEQGITIRYISFAGYSLGGLVSRYVIGLLYTRGFFDNVKPMNFTTFATPHLGIRKPLTGFSFGTAYNSLFNFTVSSCVTGNTGMDLYLFDHSGV